MADVDAAGGEASWRRVLERLRFAKPAVPAAVQVRAKDRPSGSLEKLAREAAEILGRSFPLTLNGPAGMARELGFAGVHWPESQIPHAVPPEAAQLMRSASVHNLAALRAAERVAHYVVFGPVFAPGSKAGLGVGVEALREFCREARVPVLAIGGVTRDTVAVCLQAGAAGVAVVSAVLRAGDPVRALEEVGGPAPRPGML
ncbi:MAG: thiamine phosphate synthase [Armatimonadota bacterium]|nr:thiamine phosphate synthase [Armatimonadota bacterium]